jgi:putative peptidoglycan lipid II flippase
MAAGTLASRITGVFRDIALVAAIGTGVFSDTYSVANSIPNIIYILI